MKVSQYAVRAHRETRAAFLVCEKTFDSRTEVQLAEPSSIAQFLNDYADASELPNEKTWLFCLNGAGRLIGFSEVTQGMHDQTHFDLKRTLQIALMTGAFSIVVAHNHPSGSTEPSDPDRLTTDRLKEACALVDVPLMDHIIVSYKGYYSFREHGNI